MVLKASRCPHAMGVRHGPSVVRLPGPPAASTSRGPMTVAGKIWETPRPASLQSGAISVPAFAAPSLERRFRRTSLVCRAAEGQQNQVKSCCAGKGNKDPSPEETKTDVEVQALPPCCAGKAAAAEDVLAEAGAVETTAAASAVMAEHAPKKVNMAKLAVQPTQHTQQTGFSTGPGLQLIGVGVISAAVLGAAVYFGKRFIRAQMPEMKKAMDERTLAKESQIRLNDFVGRLKAMPTCDLSAQVAIQGAIHAALHITQTAPCGYKDPTPPGAEKLSKNLGEEGCQYVIEALAFNAVCVALDLGKNGIGVQGTAALVQALEHNDMLQTLIMDTNSLGDEGAELLAGHLAGDMSIKDLNLSGNSIGDPGARALAEAIKVNTTITNLNLGSNIIDYEGAVALAEALQQNDALQTLVLSDNYIGAMGASALASALKSNSALKKLHLKSNDLGDDGVGAICQALKESKAKIVSLDLGQNNMTEKGAAALAEYLQGNENIEELLVNMNDIGNGGMYKVAEAMKTCKNLKSLDLNGNNFNDEGMVVLANALKGNQKLSTLELGYNPMGEKGVKALVEIAKYDLPAIETLKLGWCSIGGKGGALAVSDLIMYNTTLRTLDLRGNNMGNDGAIQVSRGMRQHQNAKFDELDLSYNEIKDDGAFALAQALKANATGSVQELKLSSNYITKIGQVALIEAVDMVYDMSGKTRELTIHF